MRNLKTEKRRRQRRRARQNRRKRAREEKKEQSLKAEAFKEEKRNLRNATRKAHKVMDSGDKAFAFAVNLMAQHNITNTKTLHPHMEWDGTAFTPASA